MSGTGKVPVLIDGDVHVWESLAILEYLAEKFPAAGLWPADAAARAHARAIANEMHAGFLPLRRHLPMNMWRPVIKRDLTPEVAANVQRIEAIWSDCRARFGQGGPFLFGRFGAADAMYAPVVARLHTYAVDGRRRRARLYGRGDGAAGLARMACRRASRSPGCCAEDEVGLADVRERANFHACATLIGGRRPKFCQDCERHRRVTCTALGRVSISGAALRRDLSWGGPGRSRSPCRYVFSRSLFHCSRFAAPAFAADANHDIKGLYLLTDYPAVTVQPGTTSTVNLKLRNYALAPERLALSVAGVPQGWTATLLGGGQPIAAAMPATDDSVSLDLRLDVPKDAKIGTPHADGRAPTAPPSHITLPVAVTLAKELPAKLTLSPQLPELRGSARSSFEYTMTIKNDSGKKLLVSLAADAPRNFDTSFTEAYGTQQLTAIPVEAGKSKDVKLKVSPPDTVDAGHYPVTARIAAEDAHADAKVALDITGQPKLVARRPRGPAQRARHRRQAEFGPGGGDQYRHRAGREHPTVGQCAERLEDRFRAEDHRPHRAQRAQGSAGADHARRARRSPAITSPR